eukprot:gene15021-biopygen6639
MEWSKGYGGLHTSSGGLDTSCGGVHPCSGGIPQLRRSHPCPVGVDTYSSSLDSNCCRLHTCSSGLDPSSGGLHPCSNCLDPYTCSLDPNPGDVDLSSGRLPPCWDRLPPPVSNFALGALPFVITHTCPLHDSGEPNLRAPQRQRQSSRCHPLGTPAHWARQPCPPRSPPFRGHNGHPAATTTILTTSCHGNWGLHDILENIPKKSGNFP